MKDFKFDMRLAGLIIALVGAFLILKWRWPGLTVAVIGFYIMHAGTEREKRQERKHDDLVREKVRQRKLAQRTEKNKPPEPPASN
ncbi:MAG: hypothetical protein ACYC6V_06910 [Bacillota bacterium]